MKLTKPDLIRTAAYAAGYIDGEGCITVSGRRCRIMVSNTYPHTLYWLRSVFGGTVSMKNDKSRPEHHRPAYSWSISGKAASDMLEICMPYLQEKRKQARLAIEYVGTDGLDARKKIGKLISALKHKAHGA